MAYPRNPHAKEVRAFPLKARPRHGFSAALPCCLTDGRGADGGHGAPNRRERGNPRPPWLRRPRQQQQGSASPRAAFGPVRGGEQADGVLDAQVGAPRLRAVGDLQVAAGVRGDDRRRTGLGDVF